jgi:excisionase family DNA binding protein
MTVAEGNMGEEKPWGDEVMNYEGLAAYLKMAEGTLRHYVMREEIPFAKIGAHVRFLKHEIDRWLLDRNHRPAGKGTVKSGAVKGESGMLPWAAVLEDKEQ